MKKLQAEKEALKDGKGVLDERCVQFKWRQ